MSKETPKATDMSRTEKPTPTPTEIAAAICHDLLRERLDTLTGLSTAVAKRSDSAALHFLPST